jgi:hypothetical protein
MSISAQDRVVIESIKGAFLPSIKSLPVRPELVAIALRELADTVGTTVITVSNK